MNLIKNSSDNLDDSSVIPRTFKEEMKVIQMDIKSSAEQIFKTISIDYPVLFGYFHNSSNLYMFSILLLFNVFYLRSRIFYLILQVWFYYVIYHTQYNLYMFLVPKWQFYGMYLTAIHIIWDREYFGMSYNKLLYDHLIQKHYMQFLKKLRYVDKHGKERHPPMLTIYIALLIFLKKYIYERTFLFGLVRDIIWLIGEIIAYFF